MTNLEFSFLVLDVVILIVVNMAMVRKKENICSSKNLWLYFLGVKSTAVLPALLTGLQLYVFTFDFVVEVGNTMFHWVLYCYIGYLLIAGFMIFMESNQTNLFLIFSIVLLGYQCLMAYQLIDNHTILQITGQTGYNPFRYGIDFGYFICVIGPILSLLSCMTSVHYWKANNRDLLKIRKKR